MLTHGCSDRRIIEMNSLNEELALKQQITNQIIILKYLLTTETLLIQKRTLLTSW